MLCCLLIVSCFIAFCKSQRIAQAEEKPSYVVLVSRKSDKPTFDKYVLQRQNRFNVVVLSLEELGVLNNVTGIKTAIKKLDYPKGTNLAVDSKVKVFEKTKITERYVSGNIDQTNEAEISSLSYLWEQFNVGIVDPLAEFPSQKKEKIAIAGPVDIYNRYTIGICCDTGTKEESKGLSEIANIMSVPIDTYFETRGTYKCNVTPKYPIVDLASNINQYGILYVRNTNEPVSVFSGLNGWKYSEYDYPTTSVWIDTDKNQHVDNYNAEITTEQYWNGLGFQGLLISDTIKPPNFKGFCVTRNNYQYTDIDILRFFMLNVDQQKPISVAIQNLYKAAEEVALKREDIFFKKLFSAIYGLTWVLYGPPEMTLTDFIELPKVLLKPNSLNEIAEPEIDFGYSTRTVFTIANIGIADLIWNFSTIPDWISITPTSGENPCNAQTDIVLAIKTIRINTFCVVPQEKCGMLILLTNDPDRKTIRIRVRAKGYYPGVFRGWLWQLMSAIP